MQQETIHQLTIIETQIEQTQKLLKLATEFKQANLEYFLKVQQALTTDEDNQLAKLKLLQEQAYQLRTLQREHPEAYYCYPYVQPEVQPQFIAQGYY